MSLNGFLKRLLGLFSNKPLCRKLVRSASYQARHQAWVKKGAYSTLIKAFHKAYHYKKAGIQGKFRVQLIEEQHRHGVLFFYDPAITAEAFSFLFDYLKEQTLKAGYRLHRSDCRKIAHDRYTQHTETYYLTPLPSNVPGSSICNQRYGNITIDHTLINRHPGYIRLIAEGYSDVHFSAPLPFPELLTDILEPAEV